MFGFQAQPLAIIKAVPGRSHEGKAALSTQDLVHSQCITISERSFRQGLDLLGHARMHLCIPGPSASI